MSATILIKRTQGTSPPTAAPVGTGVSFGELIYTYDVANVGAGKSYKKLYIGDPSGNTEAPIPIGGEYYTQVIADNPADFGKPVANKAVILNSDAKVSSWTVATDLLVGAAATVSGDLSVSGDLNVTASATTVVKAESAVSNKAIPSLIFLCETSIPRICESSFSL